MRQQLNYVAQAVISVLSEKYNPGYVADKKADLLCQNKMETIGWLPMLDRGNFDAVARRLDVGSQELRITAQTIQKL